MSFLNDLIILLKARYPIIYISTDEEERVEYIIKYCTKKYVPRTYYSWDFVDGYQGNPNDKGFATKNPLEALDLVEKLTPETASIFVLKDCKINEYVGLTFVIGKTNMGKLMTLKRQLCP